MFPTFLGIGSPKAGSTWLYELLDSHPDVFMSPDRKEIHYFDHHFDRGPEWYEGFFSASPSARPQAVGEFTPHYIYSPEAPSRVKSIPSIERFLLMVRNPVDRAVSHYRFRQRQDNRRQSFEDFLAEEPGTVAWGRYGEGFARWLEEFDRDRFLVLVFEEAIKGQDKTRLALATHLDLDHDRFPSDTTEAANQAFAPRRRRLYTSAVRQARWLRRHDFDRVISMAKRVGVVDVLKRPRAATDEAQIDIPPAVLARLWEELEADVALLERLAGLDLALWRPARRSE